MTKTTKDLGKLGEDLVARWLVDQSWQVVAQGWHCRWGELDIVAHHAADATLAFVEVKTRSRGNWDMDGLLAITPQKQQKLWQAAQLFLADYPDLVTSACRFDVALVHCRPIPVPSASTRSPLLSVITNPTPMQLGQLQLGQPVDYHGYRLVLQDYIIAAFDSI
ncbi:MAG: YraN family protein [Cyanobacteria bacterium]|nr:YraN family protein [Cyanobacteriota bacterium]MDW8200824.1 YraN family protein [Cyanobacteriota bacterium SKYGB_h_bin112]